MTCKVVVLPQWYCFMKVITGPLFTSPTIELIMKTCPQPYGVLLRVHDHVILSWLTHADKYTWLCILSVAFLFDFYSPTI